MDDVWREALTFLSDRLGAGRAVVLHEEDPTRDFEVVAARGVDPDGFWRDPNIDFGVLASVCSSGLPENRRDTLLCAPARDRNGRVVALLYGDRPAQTFGPLALTDLAEFAHGFESRLMARHSGAAAPPVPRTLSRVGGVNTRVAFLLAEQGLLSLDEAEHALARAQEREEMLERILIESGRLREEEILRALGRFYQLEPWIVNLSQISAEVARTTMPLARSRELGAVAIGYSGEQLAVALALPDNAPALDELRKLTGRQLAVRLVGRIGFQRILNALEALAEPAREEEPAVSAPTGSPLLDGRYQVEEQPMLVCRFSSLLRALDTQTGKSVVLRRLETPDSEDAQQARRQTLTEGRLMSQLSHRNLPHVERVLEEEDQIYLVLEEFSGPTLDELVKQHGPVPPASMVHLIEQLLSMVEYLHRQQPPIVHRDLRPDVLILCPDGTLKLAEFGLAKMHATAANPASMNTSFRSHGHPHFASPEQLLGQPSEPSQDIYSMGAILYFLATGVVPEKSLERCFNQALESGGDDSIPGFPAHLEQVIARLREPDGEQRPKSVAEARQLLRQIPVAEFQPAPKKRAVSLEAPVMLAPAADPLDFLHAAVAAGASDVHLEPDGARWRVNGTLRAADPPGPASRAALKTLAGLEKSGCRHVAFGNEHTLRVSLLTLPEGESLVVKLMARAAAPLTLAGLGLPAASQQRLLQILGLPQFLLLVSGKGRRSALYACLQAVIAPERKVVTLEDVVKARVPGALQLQSDDPAALRELLQQDPDVVMAANLCEAEGPQGVVLQGVSLLGGVRAADALSAVHRMVTLGFDPFLLGANLSGSLGVRVARRLCPACREKVPVTTEFQPVLDRYRVPLSKMFVARGCSECENGYRGRVGIYELLLITPELRALIQRGGPLEDLRRQAFSQGFQPLLQDGLQKAAEGLTSMEELLKVCR